MVEKLLNVGTAWNLVSSSFLQQDWHVHVKTVGVLSLRPATEETVSLQDLISLHIRIGGLYADPLLYKVESSKVEPVFGTSLIDRCSCRAL